MIMPDIGATSAIKHLPSSERTHYPYSINFTWVKDPEN